MESFITIVVSVVHSLENGIASLANAMATPIGVSAGIVTIMAAIKRWSSQLPLGSRRLDSKEVDKKLQRAEKLSATGYPVLGDGIKAQVVRKDAKALAKKETGPYLDLTTQAFLLALTLFVGAAALGVLSKILNDVFLVFCSMFLVLFAEFFLIYKMSLAQYGVSTFSDACQKFKARDERKKSRNLNYSFHYGNLSRYIEQHGSYVLIDERSERSRKNLPIKNAIGAPKNLKEFVKNLPTDTVIFVCSDFGKESYELVEDFRGIGFKNSFDLGGIKEK
jgi:hypothetical protein